MVLHYLTQLFLWGINHLPWVSWAALLHQLTTCCWRLCWLSWGSVLKVITEAAADCKNNSCHLRCSCMVNHTAWRWWGQPSLHNGPFRPAVKRAFMLAAFASGSSIVSFSWYHPVPLSISSSLPLFIPPVFCHFVIVLGYVSLHLWDGSSQRCQASVKFYLERQNEYMHVANVQHSLRAFNGRGENKSFQDL